MKYVNSATRAWRVTGSTGQVIAEGQGDHADEQIAAALLQVEPVAIEPYEVDFLAALGTMLNLTEVAA